VRRGPGPFTAAAALTLCTTAFGAASASAADLYGKPLRGLTKVAVAAIVKDPARYAAKAIRIEGLNTGSAGRPALKDGDAVLLIVSDGSFRLPQDLAGGFLAAEGRARAAETSAVFVATGVEVRHEASAR
jgi:hypothetical protein